MKLTFESNLAYQQEAIQAVVISLRDKCRKNQVVNIV